jgi:hypothetical protein
MINISEKDFLNLMQRAFDEGYKGYQETRDSVVDTLINEWKTTNEQDVNAIVQSATENPETKLRKQQAQRRRYWSDIVVIGVT